MRLQDSMGLFKLLFGKSKRQSQTVFKEKTVKILVLGKENVGKTSIIRKLCDQEEFVEQYKATLYDVYEKKLDIDEYKVNMQFMDLGGSQPFPSMLEVFIRQADVFILVYAHNNNESFKRLNELREQIQTVKHKHITELPVIVVQSKIDLRGKRTKRESMRRKSVAQWCYLSHNVSAKSGVKINAIMDSIIEETKFIGNESDLTDVKISGRYVYQEEQHPSSEVYHKAPTLFKQHDNSDEKMDRRRKRSLQIHARKNSQVRSNSMSMFNSFRRASRVRKFSREDELIAKSFKTPSINAESISHTSFDINQSKESLAKHSVSSISMKSNSPNSSMKDVSVLTQSAKIKRKVFRSMKRTTAVEENIENNYLKPTTVGLLYTRNGRRKSLSSNDLSTLIEAKKETKDDESELKRSRTASLSENKDNRKYTRQRSVSVNEQMKKVKHTKSDIVHTTLQAQKSNELQQIPIITGRFYQRSLSYTAKELNLKRLKNLPGRKLSTSIDALSDSNDSIDNKIIPVNVKNMRRRSRSHNDLQASIRQFQQIHENSNQHQSKFAINLIGRKKSIRSSIKGSKVSSSPPRSIAGDDIKRSNESLTSENRFRTLSKSEKKRTKKLSVMSFASPHTKDPSALSRVNTLKQLSRRKSSSWNDVTNIKSEDDFFSLRTRKNSNDSMEIPTFNKFEYSRSSSDDQSTAGLSYRAKNWMKHFNSNERLLEE